MITSYPFPLHCEPKILSELVPSNIKHFYYPGAIESGGHDGLTVRVNPNKGDAWIGTFASGKFGPKTVSGIFSTPDPARLCVVSEGQAYIVDVTSPTVYETLPLIPIIAVRDSEKHQLLIFANHTELLAIGSNGIAWRTERLSWDGLRLTQITDDVICGTFWDIQTESEQSFTVDLATGAHLGGASLPF